MGGTGLGPRLVMWKPDYQVARNVGNTGVTGPITAEKR